MSATIDGVRWDAAVISAAAIQGGVLRIAGQDRMKPPFVALGVAVPPKVGTYSVNAATGAGVAASLVQAGGGMPVRQWNADGGAGSGTIALTSLTSTGATGTFSFTLERSLAACMERVEQLERERRTDITRMGAMQAELDYLRARLGP